MNDGGGCTAVKDGLRRSARKGGGGGGQHVHGSVVKIQNRGEWGEAGGEGPSKKKGDVGSHVIPREGGKGWECMRASGPCCRAAAPLRARGQQASIAGGQGHGMQVQSVLNYPPLQLRWASGLFQTPLVVAHGLR
jgi:hypothetical protein